MPSVSILLVYEEYANAHSSTWSIIQKVASQEDDVLAYHCLALLVEA